MEENKIAFKDFKSAVGTKEFEAVLKTCRLQYEKVNEVAKRREEFIEKAQNKFSKENSAFQDESVKKGLNILVNALIKKSDEELLKIAADELSNIYEITEFLQRFSSKYEYPHINLSFLNKQ